MQTQEKGVVIFRDEHALVAGVLCVAGGSESDSRVVGIENGVETLTTRKRSVTSAR